MRIFLGKDIMSQKEGRADTENKRTAAEDEILKVIRSLLMYTKVKLPLFPENELAHIN